MTLDQAHSFGRNVDMLFGGSSKFAGMGEKPLESVTTDENKDKVTFKFEDGSVATFGVEGDCCSQSWIEELTVPENVKGQTLVDVQDEFMEETNNDEFDCLRTYQTKFRTDKGETITLEYRNSSNGYYGGYLVRLDAGDFDRW